MAWTDDTADQLLTDVRNTGFLPDASDQTDAVLLRFADSELRTMIAAAVKANRGEHWLRYEDTTIVAGTTRYRLPRRALAGTTRAVMVVDPSGMTWPLIEEDPITLRSRFRSGDVATPRWFAFEDDFVNLGAVEAGTGWTLRVHYVLRPSALVTLGGYASLSRITRANSTTSVTLYDAATMASFVKYTQFDIVRGTPPYPVAYFDRFSNSDYTNPGPDVTLYGGTPIVVADFTIDGFAVYPATPGRDVMWWVPRDTTPFPMIPKTLWEALVHGVVAQALEAVRDPGAGAMRAGALIKLRDAIALMAPRDQRNSKRIISASALRTGGRSVRRLWRPS